MICDLRWILFSIFVVLTTATLPAMAGNGYGEGGAKDGQCAQCEACKHRKVAFNGAETGAIGDVSDDPPKKKPRPADKVVPAK
ncbi:MAG: hypothetical protein HY074_16325 [Deltaproteobacteria bacterium]|nr:hypothetical protein [Deltaproteobacteria bacterium]